MRNSLHFSCCHIPAPTDSSELPLEDDGANLWGLECGNQNPNHNQQGDGAGGSNS